MRDSSGNDKPLLIRATRAAASLGMTVAGMKKVAARDPDFPSPIRFTSGGYTFYRVADIEVYIASKAAATTKRAPPHDPAAARAARTAKAARVAKTSRNSAPEAAQKAA